jgi:heptosyltransferase I
MSARARLLIIKTSSLGDVVHALPAVSDIIAAKPGWQIDWVCEEAFADIPKLHPGVAHVIPCAIRKWRRSWWSGQSRHEMARFKETLRQSSYDIVLDLQGLLKSAWIARQASGERHGYTWGSAREPLATLAYDVRHVVAWNQHAIARNRQLAGAALGYQPDGVPRYGVMVASTEHQVAVPYVVVLHATSRADKLWPEADWRRLFVPLAGRGLRIVLPWGTPVERERSERLATGINGAVVPARMAPKGLAGLFAAARMVVGVDTGLLHLAVAAGAPALAVFGPTNPALTGVQGERAPALNLGGDGVVPDVVQVLNAANKLLAAGAERPALATLP